MHTGGGFRRAYSNPKDLKMQEGDINSCHSKQQDVSALQYSIEVQRISESTASKVSHGSIEALSVGCHNFK